MNNEDAIKLSRLLSEFEKKNRYFEIRCSTKLKPPYQKYYAVYDSNNLEYKADTLIEALEQHLK